MTSPHVRRIGAVLAAYLAVVAIHDADTLRKQRRDEQPAATDAARPSPIRNGTPRPTLATERDGSATAGERPSPAVVRLDKLV
jgi:hypothetical protein